MITDYIPGAYITHDMLHIRGGHQTQWLLDGVPVINTAIAVNVGPQIDPNDIDYLEVNRGSYGRNSATAPTVFLTSFPAPVSNATTRASCCSTAGNFWMTDVVSISEAIPSVLPITSASMGIAAILDCNHRFRRNCA